MSRKIEWPGVRRGIVRIRDRGPDGTETSHRMDVGGAAAIGRSSPLGPALAALERAGFITVSSRRGWHEGERARGDDERSNFSMHWHPAGIIVSVTGYSGWGGDREETVNAMNGFVQASPVDQRVLLRDGPEGFELGGSGGMEPNMDGSFRHCSHTDFVNGYEPFGKWLGALADKVVEGVWTDNAWLWVERGHWTDRVFSGEPRKDGSDDALDEEEWTAWLAGVERVSPEAARLIARHGARHHGRPERDAGRTYLDRLALNEYLCDQSQAAGIFGPLPGHEDRMVCRGVAGVLSDPERARASGTKVLSMEIPGGATSGLFAAAFSGSSVEGLVEAIGRAPLGVVEAVFSKRDASGDTFASFAMTLAGTRATRLADDANAILAAGVARLGEAMPVERSDGGFLERLAVLAAGRDFQFFMNDRLESITRTFVILLGGGADVFFHRSHEGVLTRGREAFEAMLSDGVTPVGELDALLSESLMEGMVKGVAKGKRASWPCL